jgi:hypothetical protein
MQVQYLTGAGTTTIAIRRRFLAQALDAVRRVPGVAAPAFTSQLPLSGDQYWRVWRASSKRTGGGYDGISIRDDAGLLRDAGHSRCVAAACSTSA